MASLLLLFLIAVPVVIGAAATAQLWTNRRHPRVRKYLALLWVGVLVSTLMLLIAVPFGIAVGVYQTYQWLEGVALNQGFPAWCATIVACLLAVPLLYLGLVVMDPFTSRKWRWGGLTLLALLFGTLFGLGLWFKTAIPGAFTLAGESKKGAVYLPGGRLKICDYPGQIDPITGRPCQPLTPSELQHLDPEVAAGAKSIRIEEPEAFYDQDSQPMVWVCVNDEGVYSFVSAPHYIEPTTGKPCVPISAGWIQRYRQDQQVKKQKAEQERLKAERVAEQARVEAERRRIEEQQQLAERAIQRQAEEREERYREAGERQKLEREEQKRKVGKFMDAVSDPYTYVYIATLPFQALAWFFH